MPWNLVNTIFVVHQIVVSGIWMTAIEDSVLRVLIAVAFSEV